MLEAASAAGSECCELPPSAAAAPPCRWRRCVDLGCGTGLMGPLLRNHVADSLVGVDLSAGMVVHARDRGCYDDLAVGELVEYLQQLKAGRRPWRF